MNGKHKGRLIAIFTVLMLLLNGCGSQVPSQEEDYESAADVMIVWAWDENFNILAANMAIEKYREAHENVRIEVISMSQEETVARLNSAIVSGADNLLPDIVLIEDYRIQHFLKNYEKEFADLSYLRAEDFASYKMGVNQIDGKIYGVPFDSGVVGLFYRLDYIEKAGYREADMKNLTWEEYIEIGKAVKQATGKEMLTLDPSDLPLIRMMLQSAGEWYCDDSGAVHIEGNQALEDAIEIYLAIVEAQIARPISDWSQFIQAFQTGEVASVVSGSWISSTILETEEQNGLWRVVRLPRMENNANAINASSVGGSGWYVMKNSKHRKEAERFLQETFASDEELINDLVAEINLVSTLKSAEESENYQKGVAFYGGQTVFSEFIEWTYEIPAVNYGTDTYGIEGYVAEAIQKILTGADIADTLAEYQKFYVQDMN